MFGIFILITWYSRELVEIIKSIAHAFSISEEMAASIILLGVPIYFVTLPALGALWRRRVVKRALGKLEIIAARSQETSSAAGISPCVEALAPPTNIRGASLGG
jgi:hypothetical protein